MTESYQTLGNEPYIANRANLPPPPPPPQNPYNNPNIAFNNQPYGNYNQGYNAGNQGFNGGNQYNAGNQGYNQGFNGGNQGFSNQGYNNNQGFIPPPYIPPVANIICPLCRRETSTVSRKVAGGVTWIWCFVLFIFTGICFCIPFCVDSCKDTELLCAICQAPKSRIPANCC